jgi:hypothetical protein
MQQQTFAEASFEPYRKPVRWIFRSVLRIVKPSILVTTRAAVLVLMTLISAGLWYERPALAEVTVTGRASLFYTDVDDDWWSPPRRRCGSLFCYVPLGTYGGVRLGSIRKKARIHCLKPRRLWHLPGLRQTGGGSPIHNGIAGCASVRL